MEATKMPPEVDQGNRARGRLAFFSWFFALFGMGAAMLALLLIGTGEVRWSSPAALVLLALSAIGIACLAIVLAGIFRARHGGPGKEEGR